LQIFRTIKHDMKHHIREINDLLMKDKVQQAKDYLQQMSDEIISAQNIYNTGNEAFDGILNFYAEKYMNKGLELVVSVVIPENLKINILYLRGILQRKLKIYYIQLRYPLMNYLLQQKT